MPDVRPTRRDIRRLGALLDELEIGLVSMDIAEDYANVNRSAATLLNTEAGDTTASECAGIVRGLIHRTQAGPRARWRAALDPPAFRAVLRRRRRAGRPRRIISSHRRRSGR